MAWQRNRKLLACNLHRRVSVFFIAAFRIIYEGGKLRRVLIEAPFLGLAALVFSHGVALLGINQDVAPFFLAAWSALSA